MKKLIQICLITICYFSATTAQALKTSTDYSYDANGNRISATVIYLTTSLKTAEINIDSLFQTDTTNLPKEGWKKPQTDITEESEILIYPNPTHGELLLRYNSLKPKNSFVPKEIIIQIWDVNGKVILKKSGSSNYLFIDLSQQQNGTYLIKVNTSETEKYFKLIKN